MDTETRGRKSREARGSDQSHAPASPREPPKLDKAGAVLLQGPGGCTADTHVHSSRINAGSFEPLVSVLSPSLSSVPGPRP